LQTREDCRALVQGIKSGVIDCIASDHAPHAAAEKAGDFEKAPFGIIGMETSFSILYDRLVRTGIIDLKRLIELISLNPARILHLAEREEVKQDFAADLTLLDLEQPFRIDPLEFESKSVNCPFGGWEGKGVVAYTIVAGNVVYRRR
jgi:dihydroorotase